MKAIINWLRRLFGRPTTQPTPLPTVSAPAPAPAVQPVEPKWTYIVDFTSDTSLPIGWSASTWIAPGRNATHVGTSSPRNITFGERGVCLRLNQERLSDGTFTSSGAEIFTEGFFGYGIFEWEAMASADAARNPVSGSITGLFIYRDQATTEIDFEMEGNERNHLTLCTSWVHEAKPNQHTKIEPPSLTHLPHQQFCKYRFVWSPGQIEFWRDGELITTHKRVVPTQEARVMINHWGTNSVDWGGLATPNVERFMYVKSFKYAPL